MSRIALPQGLMLALVSLLISGCSSTAPENSVRPDPEGAAVRPQPSTQEDPPVISVNSADLGDLRQREAARRHRAAVLVDHFVKIGQAALDRGRLRTAQRAFASALDVDPTHKNARRLWRTVSSLLGDTAVARDAESRATWDTMRAPIDQITFLARERFRRARHFHGESDYDNAILEYHKAKILLEANPQIDADFDALRIKAAIQRCEADQVAATRRAEARRIEDAHAVLRAEDAKERRKIQSRVRRLWRMANEAYDQGEYAACERLCEKILELDPGNQVVKRLRR